MKERTKIILLIIIALTLIIQTTYQIFDYLGYDALDVFKPDMILEPEPQSIGHAQSTLPKTTVYFDKTEHDFGTIKEGDKVAYAFKLTNTGKNPLVINNARGSCGCTVPSWPKDPIASGETGEILVEFNSKGRAGQQKKVVTILANTEVTPLQLLINANVEKQE